MIRLETTATGFRLWLGERLGRVRLMAALVILCGILLIRLG